MRRALAIVAMCGVALAGCGDDAPSLNGEEKKSAQQVVDDAKAALAATPAVHVAGTIGVSGSPSEVDLQLQGQDAAGSQSLAGLKVEIVSTGGSVYVKAPTGFWQSKAPGSVADRLSDRWVRFPSALASGLGQVTPRGLAEQLTSADSQLQPEVKRGDVDGRPAVIVSQQNGSQLFVANTGDPVPLRIVNQGSSAGTLNFTGYGQVQPITAPPGTIELPGLPSIPGSLPDVPLPTGIPTIPDDLPTIPDDFPPVPNLPR